jgi:hypothetical protein
VHPAERTTGTVVDPMNLNQIILAEGKNTNSDIKSAINVSSSKKAALTAIMSALIAVTTLIAIPLPPPLSTINLQGSFTYIW